ncbi:MAG: gamma-glutamyltransferase, partial [Candidatus Omnitrophica bacterium]|nr:gamma-glutamyltransferase [Candidatus Omnitrophota bacterium]
TKVALEVLKQGGNAVDAAVTAEWMLNVVEPQASGIGGGGFFLFYDVGTRRILSFDGSVKAPAKAFPKMFLDAKGKPLPYQPERNTGGLPVGVPGLLKLIEEVHAKYGTHKFPFAKLMEPAIRQAEEGAEVSATLAKALQENAKRLALLDPERTLFFKKGVPFGEGQKFFQPELAKAFRLIQAKGAEAFYEGVIAKAIARSVRKNAYREGLLDEKDLENYTVEERDPIHATYQGYDLFSAAPPADGGVMLFRGLNLLSSFGIPGFGQTPETYHLLGEAQKVAFSDQSGVADPDLFEVPLKELLSESWAQDRASVIQFDQVLKSEAMKVEGSERGKKRAGSSIMIVDSQGNIAILSATLGDAFGSALKVPGYGFFLNDLLTSFAADPASAKNANSAELISGGQRPRGTEASTLIFKEGKPSFLVNAYGEDDPAAVLLNVLIQKIDLGASCSGAVEFPRLLVRGKALRMESGLYDQEMIRLKLALLGHDIEKEDAIGTAQMVCFEEGSGRIDGESDPRASGEAAGF